MARKLQPREPDVYAIIDTVNGLVDGRSNNVGLIANPNGGLTLTPGAVTTSVNFPTISLASTIHLTPRTANAAAAIPTTWISSVLNGSFTVTHANNAQVDRKFDFSCVGG